MKKRKTARQRLGKYVAPQAHIVRRTEDESLEVMSDRAADAILELVDNDRLMRGQ